MLQEGNVSVPDSNSLGPSVLSTRISKVGVAKTKHREPHVWPEGAAGVPLWARKQIFQTFCMAVAQASAENGSSTSISQERESGCSQKPAEQSPPLTPSFSGTGVSSLISGFRQARVEPRLQRLYIV